MRNNHVVVMTCCLIAALLIQHVTAFAAPGVNRMSRYNVVWNTPSRDATGVMPLGNGDLAAGVYAIENGDLYCCWPKMMPILTWVIFSKPAGFGSPSILIPLMPASPSGRPSIFRPAQYKSKQTGSDSGSGQMQTTRFIILRSIPRRRSALRYNLTYGSGLIIPFSM